MYQYSFRRVSVVAASIAAGLSLGLALSAGAAPAKKASSHKPAAVAPVAIETPKATVERVCQSCHDLGTVAQSQHAADEWPAVVKRMRGNGAQMTDVEAKRIQEYLAATYSKP